MIEDIDFKLAFTSGFYLGRKSLAVNLSDIAAMGGEPRFALLGLALSSKIDSKWIDDFLAGFKSMCKDYEINLVGGDISRANKIFISVSVLGDSERIIERKGARPGDLIFVTGYLGDASYGLRLLKKGIKLENREYLNFLKAFLDPTPQVELGKKLNSKKLATSMIDISDGLSTDLFNICTASKVGAKIYQEKIPLSDELLSEPIRTGDKYKFALHGGEDFQLLFTVPSSRKKEIDELPEKVTCIGYITKKDEGVKIINLRGKEVPLLKKGYEHNI
jgi:thiamine-monophosphate kinase